MTRRRDNIELDGNRIRGLHYWNCLPDGTILADGHVRVRSDMPDPVGFPAGTPGTRSMHVRIVDVPLLPAIDESCLVRFSGRRVRDADTSYAMAIDTYRIARLNV